MYQATAAESHHGTSNNNQTAEEGAHVTDYTELTYHNNNNNSHRAAAVAQNAGLDDASTSQHSNISSRVSRQQRVAHRGSSGGDMDSSETMSQRSSIPMRRQGTVERTMNMNRGDSEVSDRSLDNDNSSAHPPLLEIPEEVYAVRKSALQVLKPLTRSWVR